MVEYMLQSYQMPYAYGMMAKHAHTYFYISSRNNGLESVYYPLEHAEV